MADNDTTIADLLAVINENKAKIEELSLNLDAVKKDLSDTRELNRALLKSKVEVKQPCDDTEKSLEKFRKFMEEKL